MSADRFKNLIANGRPRVPRVGLVTSVSLADSVCMVLVNEGEVPAFLTDQVWDFVEVGAVVTILPVGETYQVIATQGSSAGAGGILLGPELIPNGGFEYGSTQPDHWGAWPWVAGNQSTARDTTPGESVSGSARYLITLGPDPSIAPIVAAYSEAFAVDAGTVYQAQAWVKASALDAALTTTVLTISAPDAANATYFGTASTLLVAATVVSPGAAYQLVTGPVTIPAGDHFARLFLRAESTNPATDLTVSWDEASLRQRIN